MLKRRLRFEILIDAFFFFLHMFSLQEYYRNYIHKTECNPALVCSDGFPIHHLVMGLNHRVEVVSACSFKVGTRSEGEDL